LGGLVLPGPESFGRSPSKGAVLESKSEGEDRVPNRGDPGEGVAGMGKGVIVYVGVVAEASGHAFDV
jgi:hypothetical protein